MSLDIKKLAEEAGVWVPMGISDDLTTKIAQLQAFADAVLELAAVQCEIRTEKYTRTHSHGAMGQMCGIGDGDASECMEAIRALKSKP